MGLTELAAGMDSTPLPVSHELRLVLDADTDISSTPVFDGASDQRLDSSATADAQPECKHAPAAPLCEQAHLQAHCATPHTSAAAWQDVSSVDPAAPFEVSEQSEAKPGVTGAWQTPLSSLRALLAARMHGRRSTAETAQPQQTAVSPPHSLLAMAHPVAETQPTAGVKNTDMNVSTARIIAASAEPQARQRVAEAPADAGGSVDDVQSVLDVCRHCDACKERPQKRRRTAREVVCAFFGVQDSDFAVPAAKSISL